MIQFMFHCIQLIMISYELLHEKTCTLHARETKTQITGMQLIFAIGKCKSRCSHDEAQIWFQVAENKLAQQKLIHL